jgi:VanZ family protein
MGHVVHSLVMRILWWIPAIISGAVIYWFSDQSQPPGRDLSPDFVMHFIGYGLFSLAIAVGITSGFQKKLTLGRVFGAFLIALAYGFSDEFHQSFVPGRTASVFDIIADSLGAIVFLASAALIDSFGKHRAQQ